MGDIIFTVSGIIAGIATLIFLFCIPAIFISKKNRVIWGKRCLISLSCIMVSMFILNVFEEEADISKIEIVENKTTDNKEKKPNDPVESMATWKEQFPENLIVEIENAFSEIGENPNNIESIKYRDTRKTDLFERHNYVVEFFDNRENLSEVFDNDKMGWIHNSSYLITTEEWYDGEPEKKEYPEEYLLSIKFWNGEDITTNINQWTHTGLGDLQTTENKK